MGRRRSSSSHQTSSSMGSGQDNGVNNISENNAGYLAPIPQPTGLAAASSQQSVAAPRDRGVHDFMASLRLTDSQIQPGPYPPLSQNPFRNIPAPPNPLPRHQGSRFIHNQGSPYRHSSSGTSRSFDARQCSGQRSMPGDSVMPRRSTITAAGHSRTSSSAPFASHSPSVPSRPQPHSHSPITLPPSPHTGDMPLPRWQPDSEVDSCFVCGRYFTFLNRRHHCRKCGRVVCANCSPHRIYIPRQYVVNPPSLVPDDDEHSDNPLVQVRICNPCVPDPNNSPPQLPDTGNTAGSLSSGYHSRTSLDAPPPYPSTFATAHQMWNETPPASTYPRRYSRPIDPAYIPSRVSPFMHSPPRPAPPPTPTPAPRRIRQEDICPVCFRPIPSIVSIGDAVLDEQEIDRRRAEHIQSCLETHSQSPPANIRSLLTYTATEKDCANSEECVICFEEYAVGDKLARMVCLCRFHEHCIRSWWERKDPGNCPVHQ
ncbi:FYVE-domain-containing protein [Westerdykella ornata]|uniref:FYVE-domain-containing protein n=1 Tax=Westerdykella ornata TaxID=318751 RepID=A0A6A6JGP4_WESOR|nr:FYVE-domain-containing protein [Westerdykella ornata]KAF2274389.1 FYVE-domain-containing protein [Westerdykella ornata]